MTVKFPFVFLLLLIAGTGPVIADDEPRFAALASLGKLNGIALQCKYLDQMRRMKAFDQATNDSFLAYAKANRRCPGQAGFETKVSEHIAAVRQAFRVQP